MMSGTALSETDGDADAAHRGWLFAVIPEFPVEDILQIFQVEAHRGHGAVKDGGEGHRAPR